MLNEAGARAIVVKKTSILIEQRLTFRLPILLTNLASVVDILYKMTLSRLMLISTLRS